MKLRTKTIIIISLFALLIFGTLNIITILVIQPSFKNIENQETKQGINQAINAINYRLSELQGKVKDYSEWDDTYDFVQTRNQEYVENNFVDETFENLNLNLIVIVDNNESLVYSQSFDFNNSAKIETSQETIKILTSDNYIWESSGDGISGIILLDNQPMLVAIGPILPSWKVSPVMGGMLFGKYIDKQEIEQLTKITGFNFSISTLNEFQTQNEDNNQIAQTLQSAKQNTVVKENSSETVVGYTLIRDINSNPLFILQVNQYRVAYQQGLWVGNIFLAVTLALSIAFGVGILILLERSIIKPLTKLASYMKEFSFDKNSEPYPISGTEEASILAKAVKDSVTQKLEAMNEVSRMVGHDLRNPLTGIKSASYILKKNYGETIGEKGNAMLKTIDDCVEYSDKIVRDLLEYSCEIKLDKIRTNPENLVNNSLSTLIVPTNIQVINEVRDDLSLQVDNGKIERVFSNLIKNAFDAMPNGGKLKITSEKVNDNIKLNFCDSGMGMSRDVIDKLWTPFFTTKAKGMGVGLSICKRIIDTHGGKIEVQSTEGKGTCFTVFLPIENNHHT